MLCLGGGGRLQWLVCRGTDGDARYCKEFVKINQGGVILLSMLVYDMWFAGAAGLLQRV